MVQQKLKLVYGFRDVDIGDFVTSGILLTPQSQKRVLKLSRCMGAVCDSALLGVLSQTWSVRNGSIERPVLLETPGFTPYNVRISKGL